MVQVNENDTCDTFPYEKGCTSNHQFFEHEGIQSHLTWQLNDTTEIKYIYGFVDFHYTFNIDQDDSNSTCYQHNITDLSYTHLTLTTISRV